MSSFRTRRAWSGFRSRRDLAVGHSKRPLQRFEVHVIHVSSRSSTRTFARPADRLFRNFENSFADRLTVEELVRGLGIGEPKAVGDQLVQWQLSVDDEARALGLTGRAESPAPVNSQLATQEIFADVERGRAALADKSDSTPRVSAAYCSQTRFGGA